MGKGYPRIQKDVGNRIRNNLSIPVSFYVKHKQEIKKVIIMDANLNPIESIMKLGDLRIILTGIVKELGYDLEVWLSCDEEGNEFLPMSANAQESIGIDTVMNRIILFPCHP